MTRQFSVVEFVKDRSCAVVSSKWIFQPAADKVSLYPSGCDDPYLSFLLFYRHGVIGQVQIKPFDMLLSM